MFFRLKIKISQLYLQLGVALRPLKYHENGHETCFYVDLFRHHGIYTLLSSKIKIWCPETQQTSWTVKWPWYWKPFAKKAKQKDRIINSWWHYEAKILAASWFLLGEKTNKNSPYLECTTLILIFYVINYTLESNLVTTLSVRIMFFFKIVSSVNLARAF